MWPVAGSHPLVTAVFYGKGEKMEVGKLAFATEGIGNPCVLFIVYGVYHLVSKGPGRSFSDRSQPTEVIFIFQDSF